MERLRCNAGLCDGGPIFDVHEAMRRPLSRIANTLV